MRILFFVDCLTAGGKERRLVELLKGLKQKKNIDFELVVMSNDIHYQQVFELNIKIHYLIRKTKKDFSVFSKFYKICKDYRPDIVHCWDCMTAVISVPACKLLHIKLANGMVIDTPVNKNVLNKHWFRARLTFPFSNIIIGNSKAGLEAYGAPNYKSACVYNGIDLKRFDQLKDPDNLRSEICPTFLPGDFVAGMVAAFEERKDYQTLIKAAITLLSRNEKVHFILVGDGVNLKILKKTVPDLYSDRIHFLGKRSDIESIVNLFDVGVLLTNSKVHGEGISNSIIEYMGLSKPVIATYGGGTNEVVSDNINGFLIEPFNEEQFILKLLQLKNDKDLRERLGKGAHNTILEKFDLKIMTANYINLYNKLITKSIK